MKDMPRDFVRTTFWARHRRIVRALAEALFACDAAHGGARLDGFVGDVDSFVSQASRMLRFGLVLMLEVVHFAPLLLLWRFATFEALGRADRVRVLERMDTSRFIPLTLVLAAYKTIFCLIYFEDPEQLAATGYSSERKRWARALPMLEQAAE